VLTLRFTLTAAEAQAVQRRLLARQWHRWAFASAADEQRFLELGGVQPGA
jgi:hypothetical protein